MRSLLPPALLTGLLALGALAACSGGPEAPEAPPAPQAPPPPTTPPLPPTHEALAAAATSQEAPAETPTAASPTLALGAPLDSVEAIDSWRARVKRSAPDATLWEGLYEEEPGGCGWSWTAKTALDAGGSGWAEFSEGVLCGDHESALEQVFHAGQVVYARYDLLEGIEETHVELWRGAGGEVLKSTGEVEPFMLQTAAEGLAAQKARCAQEGGSCP